ncbi:MAG: hypothetical protein K2X66_13050 [Cyanobacteria bacterium]|nr:hypothetical protein [Cyanobacteriota bacterium]
MISSHTPLKSNISPQIQKKNESEGVSLHFSGELFQTLQQHQHPVTQLQRPTRLPPPKNPLLPPHLKDLQEDASQFAKGMTYSVTGFMTNKNLFFTSLGLLALDYVLWTTSGGLMAPAMMALWIGMGLYQGTKGVLDLIKSRRQPHPGQSPQHQAHQAKQYRNSGIYRLGVTTAILTVATLWAPFYIRGGGAKLTRLAESELNQIGNLRAVWENIKATPKSLIESFHSYMRGEAWPNSKTAALKIKERISEWILDPHRFSMSGFNRLFNGVAEPALAKTIPSVPIPKPPVIPKKFVLPTPTAPMTPSGFIKPPESLVVKPPVSKPVVGNQQVVFPPNVRMPDQLGVQHVYKQFMGQLKPYTEAELVKVVEAVASATKTDPARVREVLHLASAYGNMDTLNHFNQLRQHMVIPSGANTYLANDYLPGSLSSILGYLKGKGSFADIKMQELSDAISCGKKVFPLLTEELLHFLENTPGKAADLLKHIKKEGGKILLPAGWHGTLNPLNQGSETHLYSQLKTLVEQVNQRMAQKSLSGVTSPLTLPEAFKLVTTEPLWNRLKALSQELGNEVIVFESPLQAKGALDQKFGDLKEIAKRLSPQHMSEAQIQDVLKKVSPEPAVQQTALEMLIRSGEVHSPRSVGIALSEIHQKALARAKDLGVAPEHIYLFTHEINGSYNVVNAIYRRLNGIPLNRVLHTESEIVALKAKYPAEKKIFIILDDLAGSGSSLENAASSLKYKINTTTDRILIAPIASTQKAKTRLEAAFPANSSVYFDPHHYHQPIQETQYYQQLSSAEKTLFKSIFQSEGYSSTNSSIVFPWMGTDTNNQFWAKFFVDPHLLNGKGNSATSSFSTVSSSQVPSAWRLPQKP